MRSAQFESVIAKLRAAGCVFAEDEARLLISAAGSPAELAAMTQRRASGLPLEHVVGWAEFCGLRIAVDPGVFVPRRRTEFLVRQAVALLDRAATARRLVVVDLCCGSAAVGVAVATACRSGVELHAVDIDPAATQCARRNVQAVSGQVYLGDLFAPLPAALAGRVDLLVANVPYVPGAEVALLPPEARLHEPQVALDGGGDGLDVLRRVVADAPHWLAPGGWLLAETSERQADTAVRIAKLAGLSARSLTSAEPAATVLVASHSLPMPTGLA
jgi:release factor glutamine methyltransferase